MVSNYRALKLEHDKLGIQYVSLQENGTFNDSEALIYDLVRYIEGQVDKVTAAGTIAFVIVKNNKQGKPVMLYFGTNRGALKMKLTKNSLTISSEGEGVPVPDNQLHMYDYETKQLRTAPMKIPSNTWGYTSSYNYNRTGGNGNSVCTPSFTNKSSSGNYHSGGSIGNSPSTGFDVEPEDDWDRWEHYWDNKYISSKNEQEALDNNLPDGLEIREGTSDELQSQFLKENFGRFPAAALAALLEHEEIMAERKRVDKELDAYDMKGDLTEFQEKIDYWTALDEYGQRLLDASASLDIQGKKIAQAATKGVFGFRAGRPDQVPMANTMQQNTNLLGVSKDEKTV